METHKTILIVFWSSKVELSFIDIIKLYQMI